MKHGVRRCLTCVRYAPFPHAGGPHHAHHVCCGACARALCGRLLLPGGARAQGPARRRARVWEGCGRQVQGRRLGFPPYFGRTTTGITPSFCSCSAQTFCYAGIHQPPRRDGPQRCGLPARGERKGRGRGVGHAFLGLAQPGWMGVLWCLDGTASFLHAHGPCPCPTSWTPRQRLAQTQTVAAAINPNCHTLQTLRDLTAEVARLDPSASVRFAQVDGLGKIVLSNIRTPKVRVPDLLLSLSGACRPGLQDATCGSIGPLAPPGSYSNHTTMAHTPVTPSPFNTTPLTAGAHGPLHRHGPAPCGRRCDRQGWPPVFFVWGRCRRRQHRCERQQPAWGGFIRKPSPLRGYAICSHVPMAACLMPTRHSLTQHSTPMNAAPPAKPLEQEPLLAARIMVEDCMNLLLDVDDIDR